MNKAKYYIYRNLHTKTFSVRYKGKVIDHPTNFIAYNVTLKVNEKSRQKVIKTKRKNVHAFVVCDSYKSITQNISTNNEIYYNPYKTKNFLLRDKVIKNTSSVIGINGNNIYVKE